MEHKELSFEKIEKAFKTLKLNKAIDVMVLTVTSLWMSMILRKSSFSKFVRHLLKNQSFLKNVKVIPVFKRGYKENVENYRKIYILPVFSKVFERIMYNRLYEYFMNSSLLHGNQFGFQINNSNEHSILQFNYLFEIDCGFPQGFILGSLLLLIYVNDFYLASKLKLSCLLIT